ncbi:MAG: hypothetical protein C5B54_03615 [Acidobacteria bacterium]|nr:MAG: hypothetical protein C5B54_03615 [Acidobacteriota bacterium]
MANPGHDIYNMKADDVLSPKRQAEIAQLMEVLKKFHPTKIAVERELGDDRIGKDYADYLSGKHELTRNEIEQVGFRLAKELGHQNVYPVDADYDFPYQHLVNYAKANGKSQELETIMNQFGVRVKEQSDYLATHTVLETLLFMNADDRVNQEVGIYFQMAHFGDAGDWAGADLLADWFRRNMRIYTNIVKLADTPEQRILVIYGAGHLGWLQHNFESDPTFRLRKLSEFTPAPVQ